MHNRRTKLSGCIALVLLLLGGCGPFGGEGRGKLSTDEKLRIGQYRQDVVDFCRSVLLHELDSSYDAMLQAVDGSIEIYRRKNPKASYEVGARKVTITAVLKDEASKLARCGKDGRAQAARLQSALREK